MQPTKTIEDDRPDKTGTIPETVSEKRKRGRPRSWRWELAERCSHSICERMECPRSRLNWTLLMTACRLVKETLSTDEQTVLFGGSWDEMLASNKSFPRGWRSAAYELGRLVDNDQEHAVECLQAVVDARRRGLTWGDCRVYLRTMRLGRRDGSAVSLLMTLCHAVDAYRTQYPATTAQQVEGAVEQLLAVVRKTEGEDDGTP